MTDHFSFLLGSVVSTAVGKITTAYQHVEQSNSIKKTASAIIFLRYLQKLNL